LRAGEKDNVIPRRAEAWVNFRLLPGDSKDEVLAQTRKVLDDARVSVSVQEFWGESPLAPYQGEFWDRFARVIPLTIPGAVVAPMVTPGTTDSGRRTAPRAWA
jgi:carboxypeptidase PM20D1